MRISTARRRHRHTALALAALLGLLPACSHSSPARRLSAGGNTPPTTAEPLVTDPSNIYAADGANVLSRVVDGQLYRLYVPESAGDGVDVIDPVKMKVIDRYTTGLDPQHVVPAWDLKTLYATNDLNNSLTAIDPWTGKRKGQNIPVADPYNMYFTVDGREAIVVAEAQQRLDFRDPHTFEPRESVPVDCAGVDHVDFSADGTYLVATCEFAGRLVKVDVHRHAVVGYLDLKGSSPQDIKLDPAGRIFYVADKNLGGVHEIDAGTFQDVGFLKTGKDTHGLYVSRDARNLYVTNRGSGTVTLVDFARRAVVTTWTIPGGGSPDMGGVSPDGKVLWLSGRYDATVYAIDTGDGHLIGKVPVPNKPHGLAVWPQPGRFSLGHTGVMR
jgi:YVTN family beta-propeller protein